MEKLSRDVMIDITSRLPIKYVLRCKSVSKSWEALISDPLFAAAHFDRASTLTPISNYIISDTYEELLYFIETEEEDSGTSTVSKPKHLNFPFIQGFKRRPFLMGSCLGYVCLSARYAYCDETDKKLLDFINIDEEDNNETSTTSKHLNFPFLTVCLAGFVSPFFIGSCRGYVCFSSRDALDWGGVPCPNNPMYLFNPITGANILLPQFKEQRCYSCAYGFGFDVSTQECKVVLVYFRDKTFSVQVHTVGRDYSWRTNTVPTMLTDVTLAELANGELKASLPLGFNGSIHWIVLSLVDKNDRYGLKRACILSFQLDTEVFGVIPMPEPLQLIKPYFHNSMTYALQVCGGCLSIIHSPEESVVDMWVMADYNISESWVKKYSIQLNCMRRSHFRPIGFRKNGELVLHLDNEGLVSYNIDSERYTILSSCWTIPFPFPFVGSLISLKSAYGDSEKGGYHVQELSSD